MDDILEYLTDLRKEIPNLVVCGDYNICHEAIDIHDPVRNANARANNKGWRIDYNMVTEPLKEKLSRATILPEAKHSDHCPILVELN